MNYRIENELLQIDVNRCGSELWSILDKRDGVQHLWQGNPKIWARRAPNLFPVCGRLKDDTAIIDGRKYTIPLHGFLRDFEHELIEQTGIKLHFRFHENSQTLAMYPFTFTVDILYTLEDDTVFQTFKVTNDSEQEMPFSIGCHTGYMCPFDDAHTIEDYRIVFEQNETVNNFINENLVIEGEGSFLNGENTLQLHNKLFKPNFALTGLKSQWIRLEEKDSGRAVQVGIKDFSSVILWSVEDEIPFVCIEPWCGMFEFAKDYGEFKNKPYIENLPAKKSFTCTQSITICNR